MNELKTCKSCKWLGNDWTDNEDVDYDICYNKKSQKYKQLVDWECGDCCSVWEYWKGGDNDE